MTTSQDGPERLHAHVIFFAAWPSAAKQQVFRKAYDSGVEFAAHASPEGFFYLELVRDGITETLTYSRVEFNRLPAKVVFAVYFEEDGTPRLCINQTELLRVDDPMSEQPVVVMLGEPRPDLPLLSPLRNYVPEKATPAEALFIRKMLHLEVLTPSLDWYDMLQASAILRHLLLDKLANLARGRLTTKPEFLVNDFGGLREELGSEISYNQISPDHIRSAEQVLLNQDQFLAHPILITATHTTKVKDVIKTSANVYGGVHMGDASNIPGEIGLVEFDRLNKMLDALPSTAAMQAICEVALRALHPLVGELQSLSLDEALVFGV